MNKYNKYLFIKKIKNKYLPSYLKQQQRHNERNDGFQNTEHEATRTIIPERQEAN